VLGHSNGENFYPHPLGIACVLIVASATNIIVRYVPRTRLLLSIILC